jgi:DNA-binding MarR family transcriptional regulator
MQSVSQARKPRASLPLQTRLFVSLQQAADWLLRDVEQLLKARALSLAQYNVLRILRGAGPQGCSCREIAERMITRDPDITRILDRLDARGLIARARLRSDRRVVRTRITEAGLRLLQELDEPVRQLHRRQFRRMPARRLQALLQLLDELRASGPQ